MNNYKSFFIGLFIAIVVYACNSNQNGLAKTEIQNKEHSFGKIGLNDSIVHTFYLKNVSNIPLTITKVGTSCGCTTTNYTQGEIGENETASIEVLFKPEQTGIIDKSIVVETNTDPPFNVFYLKGEVK